MDEQRARIADDRRRIAEGERPLYHVVTSHDGAAVDVRIRELPLIHLFVADAGAVAEGARALVARTLGVDPMAFELSLEET